MKENNGSFVAFTLGMLTAFGPFMTDFYLPVLPGMTEWFETTPSAMELSLTMGLAPGQLFICPQTECFYRIGHPSFYGAFMPADAASLQKVSVEGIKNTNLLKSCVDDGINKTN